jgi:transcription elongation GreA/GreB family factor
MEMIILDDDKAWAKRRVAELNAEIQALGPEFYEVFNQSSETWHDNAPFDALRDRQSVLDAERQHLKQILQASAPTVPRQWPNQVGIGFRIEVTSSDGTIRHYFIAGDWTPFSGQVKDGAIVMSRNAPLATNFLGKRRGEQVTIGSKEWAITDLQARPL